MKRIIALLTISSLVVLAGCTSTQIQDNSNTEITELFNVNKNSFEESGPVIDQESDEISNPAELNDEALTWLDGNDIEIDHESFEVINNDFAKDSNTVYYKISQRLENNDFKNIVKILEGSDPNTFQILSETSIRIVSDVNSVYILNYGKGYVRINGIDSATFSIINDEAEIIGQDDVHYLLSSSNSDGYVVVSKSEFIILDDIYAKDDSHVYVTGGYGFGQYTILTDADSKTFESLGSGYAKDINVVYAPHILYEGRVINRLTESDKETFKVLTSRMAIDKNNIYNNGNLFDEFQVDLGTFTYSGVPEFFYDKNYPYIFIANSGFRLIDTDVQSFEAISSYNTIEGIWWKDSNGVYVGILDEVNELAGEYGFDYGKLNVDPTTFSDLVSKDCEDVENVKGCDEYDRFYSYKDKNGSYGFPLSKIISHTEGFIPHKVLK